MDLTTRYLGLELRTPLVASAGPLNREIDNIRRLEHLGAGAVVLPSIFEEQIESEQQAISDLTTSGIDSFGEALTYFPAHTVDALDRRHYTDLVRRAGRAVNIPVIASLNGVTNHGWVQYARQLEEAGASAIELNVYFIPSDLALSGRDVEDRCLDILQAVKSTVKIPVAAKLSPYFSAIAHMCQRLDQAGVDGLVLFNRFYEPDIDLTGLTLAPELELSSRYEIRLPLLWIGVLAGRVKASLAASTGVDSADEVIKYLLVGADVVMTTSSLLRHGIGHMKELLEGLEGWLGARHLESVAAIRGRMSHGSLADPTAFDRANYIRTLQAYQEPAPAATAIEMGQSR
jgi:dihydroorotate dehydrogenase (fumarate)